MPHQASSCAAEPAALPAGGAAGKKKKKVMKLADMDSLFASLAPEAPADAAAAANGMARVSKQDWSMLHGQAHSM